MADVLRQTLHKLLDEEAVAPERIVILSPYRHTNSQSTWAEGLKSVDLHTEMNIMVKGKIRSKSDTHKTAITIFNVVFVFDLIK